MAHVRAGLFVALLPALRPIDEQAIGGGVGRFDFQKFSLIFYPGVSIILFYI